MTPASSLRPVDPGLRAYRVDDVRAAERAALAATPEGALMQRAATAIGVVCARELRSATGGIAGRRVVLLVGAGNNGGDALWAGARLRARGVAVTALLTGEKAHPEGLAALRAAGGLAIQVAQQPTTSQLALLVAADLVLDGLVGLGGRPGLREPAASLVERIPPRTVVVAVDVPSGVDVATGATPSRHVRADVTVSLGAPTPGLLLPPASVAAGRIVPVNLGFDLPEALVQRLDRRDVGSLWPVPAPGDDKYRRGVLGIVAGSVGYPGAAVLATWGAVRAGVGMVRYVGPDDATAAVRSAHPEIVAGKGRVQAWALGSGVSGSDDDQAAAIAEALASGLPCLVDAGALEIFTRTLEPDPDDVSDRVLLTPHAGELATLLSSLKGALGHEVDRATVEAGPYEHALRAAELTGACVLLKGATTLVVLPGGWSRSQADAPPWLATAGAGDVLAGVAGALLAGGLPPLDAGSVAAYVHGRAARLASSSAGAGARTGARTGPGTGPGTGAGTGIGGPITAGDVARHVPAAVAEALAG